MANPLKLTPAERSAFERLKRKYPEASELILERKPDGGLRVYITVPRPTGFGLTGFMPLKV